MTADDPEAPTDPSEPDGDEGGSEAAQDASPDSGSGARRPGGEPGTDEDGASAVDDDEGEHLEIEPPVDLPPFALREHRAAIVIFALMVAVFVPGLVALAMSDASPPLNRHVSKTDAVTGQGPIDAGKITSQSRIVGVDDPQTFVVTLENTGDDPAVLLDAQLVSVDRGMTLVGITGLPVPDETTSTTAPTTVVTTEGSPTTTTLPTGLPVVGYVIPPSDQAPENQVNGLEISLSVDRKGSFGALGLTIVYSSGGTIYTQTVWNGWGLCTGIPLHDCYPVPLGDLTQRATSATSTTVVGSLPPNLPPS